MFCRYVHRGASLSHRLVVPGAPDYPSVFANIRLTLVDGSKFGPSAGEAARVSNVLATSDDAIGDGNRPQCFFVEASCTASPPCGVAPVGETTSMHVGQVSSSRD